MAKPRRLKRLWKTYVWSSRDLSANVVALTEAVVGGLALAAGVLGAMGAFDIGSDGFRSAAIFVTGVILIAILVEAGDRRHTAEGDRRLSTEVRQVAAHEIGSGITDLLSSADRWMFRGGSGRWLRQTTLPHLRGIRDRDVDLMVQLLDPRDETLCRAYAVYRATQRSPADVRPDEDDPRTIQTDLLASIYATAWHSARSRMKPTIVLLRTFSPLRYDVGTEGLFVTVASQSAPALFAISSSWYYRSVVDELQQATHGHHVVQMPTAAARYPASPAGVTGSNVREALMEAQVSQDGGTVSLMQNFAEANGVDFDAVADHLHLR